MGLIAKYALALALANAQSPQVAESACATSWHEDTDGWWSCFIALETWRCEAQGWCGHEQDRATMGVMPLPDPAWAGAREWDWAVPHPPGLKVGAREASR